MCYAVVAMTLQEWLRLRKDDSPRAWHVAYRAVHSCRHTTHSLGCHHDEIEDAISESLLRMFSTTRIRAAPTTALAAWARGVLRNVAHEILRGRQSQSARLERRIDIDVDHALTPGAPDDALVGFADLDTSRLTRKQKNLFDLLFRAGFTLPGAARRLGVSLPSARERLQRALCSMKATPPPRETEPNWIQRLERRQPEISETASRILALRREGATYREIAARVSISRDAVRSRLRRLRSRAMRDRDAAPTDRPADPAFFKRLRGHPKALWNRRARPARYSRPLAQERVPQHRPDHPPIPLTQNQELDCGDQQACAGGDGECLLTVGFQGEAYTEWTLNQQGQWVTTGATFNSDEVSERVCMCWVEDPADPRGESIDLVSRHASICG